MPIITHTKDNNLRYTLSPTVQEPVYKKLVNILPAELSNVFLKPISKRKGIAWSLEDESLKIHECIPYSQLEDKEQNLISEKLAYLSTYLQEHLKTIPELRNKIDNICDLPGLDSVKLLRTNKGDRIVLSDWAHVRFDKSKGYNPFEKIIKKPRNRFPVKLHFIYSDGAPFENQPVSIAYKGFAKEHNTGVNANIDLGKLATASTLGITYADQNNVSIFKEISTLSGQEDYEITVPFYTSLKINIKDQNEKILDAYPINISVNGVIKEMLSNEGTISFKDLIAGKNIQIVDGKNSSNSLSHTLSREPNELDFIIDVPVPPPPPKLEYLSFFLYDHKKELIKDAKISIAQKDTTIKLDGDAAGKHIALKKKFTLNQQSKALIEIERNGKKKQLKHKFKIEDTKEEYHLQLTRNYWWLLLLLLPFLFLLLLNFEKSITIQVEDREGNRIADAMVEVSYEYDALFDFSSNTFFATNTYNQSKLTNEKGTATFGTMRYTAYDRLFSSSKKAKFVINSKNNCNQDTIFKQDFYSLKDIVNIHLAPQLTALDIRVLSKKTYKPIPNAKVEFSSKLHGKQYQNLQGKTNNKGILTLQNVPACGELERVFASKKDYIADSIINKSILEIKDNLKKRTLYLNEPFPCNDVAKPGDYEGGEFLFSVPKENQTYILTYRFVSLEDRLILYSGNSISGKELFDSGWVSGTHTINIIPKSYCKGCKFITAKVLTNHKRTSWSVSFECPK